MISCANTIGTDVHEVLVERAKPLRSNPGPNEGAFVVLVLGALGFRDRKETDVLQLFCSVSLIAKRSRFSRMRTTTTPQIRNLELTIINFVERQKLQ